MSAKSYDAKYRKTKHGLLRRLFHKQVLRCKRKGWSLPGYTSQEFLDFYYTDDHFLHLYNQWVLHEHHRNYTPSVDRVDPGLGYIWDNIQLMTWQENNQKGNLETRKAVYHGKSHLRGLLLIVFDSVSDASEAVGCSASMITRSCKSEKRTACGYKWYYL